MSLRLSKWRLAGLLSHHGGAQTVKKHVFLPSDCKNNSPTRWPYAPEQLKGDSDFLHCCGSALVVKMRQFIGPNI